MKKYLFSVVTPVHNVDMNMFENCARHMEQQTLGFENIEWVIVLHNCDEDHIRAVRERVGHYENVVIDELVNKIYTPSSPRNRGIDLSSARYIGFLDGDDNYRVDAIERILGFFDRSEAQMVVFRREFTLEKPGITAISETVNWDQTKECIILTADGSIENKKYNDFPFFVTSRAYDRGFLDKHNIRFDESVTISEDCYFNLEVMRYARKICYCPQLIGYNYYVNSESMLNSKKSDEEIVTMIESAVKIINRTYDYAMYPNVIIKSLCFVLSRYALSPEVSGDVKRLLKESLEVDLYSTVPIPEGRFTEPLNTLLNTLPQQVFASITNTGEVVSQSGGLRTLLSILSENKNTDYGKRYMFEDVVTARGYQHRVPVTDDAVYAPMIDLCISIGEKNIFTSLPIKWYTKKHKGGYLPVTGPQFKEFTRTFIQLLKGKQVFFWYENIDVSEVFNDGVTASNVIRISLAGYSDEYRYNAKDRPVEFTSPESAFFINTETPGDVEYIHILLALANRDVDQIICTYASETGLLFRSMMEYKERLCHDLEYGELDAAIKLSAHERKQILGYLRPDKKRADEVRKILDSNPSLNKIGKQLWPNLKYVTCYATGSQASFKKNIHKFFGDVEFSNGNIASSAGIFGQAIGDTDEFELITGTVFYEFLEEGNPDKTPALRGNLEVGKIYTLIVTTPSGLYRYKTGISIKISSIDKKKVIFTIADY